MQFRDLFERDIDRHIDPVIKQNTTEHLQQELEEYVLTPEVRRALQQLCDAYNDPRSAANGAWISGYFGSGKSHLLKMMSYLLENGQVGGKPVLDYLRPKLDRANDRFLLAALERACEQTPSQSILFEAGSLADRAAGDTGASLLNAFIRALNRAQGYWSGDQAFVANFERSLDREGAYAAFKERFEERRGRAWADARRSALFYAADIDAAFDEATGQPAGTTKGIMASYQASYAPTPEDFATWAAEYIERRSAAEPGFRLNFFVDEVGQFVAGSTPLLLTLQDIVEQLNTKCSRRAWLVVVSQEEMDQIVGQTGSEAAATFSKIQARFSISIKIPSTDANAVVKERLLEKRADALPALDALYDKHHENFHVLLDFPDGFKSLVTYDGRDDFVATYPLVNYQLAMFHDALVGLSDHKAFTGEYVSTAARNMLGVACEVLKQQADTGCVEAGDIVPFDAMFESVRTNLKSDAFSAVSQAEENLRLPDGSPDVLGARILKALLLVKYNEGFNATPENLRILLLENLNQNTRELEEQIERELRLLEAQTYIRRHGEAYEYLTNEEKDVEEEIKREQITTHDVSREVGKILREEVLGNVKVDWVNEGFATTFAYDLLVDGVAVGSQRTELKVNVLTGLSDELDRGAAAGPKELLVVLPRESPLVDETSLYLQTKNYASHSYNEAGPRATILAEKQQANEERRRELIAAAAALLDEAVYRACMADVSDRVRGQGAERFRSGVRAMIGLSYPLLYRLSMPFTKQSIMAAATAQAGMVEPGPLPAYCEEVQLAVHDILAKGASACYVGGTGSNALTARMAGGQYGWPPEPVRQAVAVLSSRHLVECLRYDAPVEGAALGQALATGKGLDTIAVRPVKSVSPQQLEALKGAYYRLFNVAATATDARGVADEFKARLASEVQAGRDALARPGTRQLPFAAALQRAVDELDHVARRDRSWIVANAAEQESALGAKLQDLRAMLEFANGPAAGIYADARRFLEREASNLAAAPELDAARRELEGLLADETCYAKSAAPQAKKLKAGLQRSIDEAVAAARAAALAELDVFAGHFRAGGEYLGATERSRARAEALIQGQRERIEGSDQVLYIRGAVEGFKEQRAGELWGLLQPAEPEPAPGPAPEPGPAPQPQPVEPGPAPQPQPKPAPVPTVTYKQVCVPAAFAGRSLSTQDEVEEFAEALRRDLQALVEAGKKIIL